MKEFQLTRQQCTRLCRIVRRYKKHVDLPKSGRKWTNDRLWKKVLGQIVVSGGARAGYTLANSVIASHRVSWNRLCRLRNEANLKKELHLVMRAVGTRYVGNARIKKGKGNKKVEAAAADFRTLQRCGGPVKFFSKIAKEQSEDERIKILRKQLKYYGDKGARDTLIELGMARNRIALDSRILQILKDLGAAVEKTGKRHYSAIERILIQKIAKPCHVDGAHLDRILFQNYDFIRADLALEGNE